MTSVYNIANLLKIAIISTYRPERKLYHCYYYYYYYEWLFRGNKMCLSQL